MISKTEQEVDYSINQLTNKKKFIPYEGLIYPIEISLADSINPPTILMCVCTHINKDGTWGGKVLPESEQKYYKDRYYKYFEN